MKLLVAVAVVLGASVAHADTALPDPTERLLRWPLSQSEHPELAPRYDVAKDLAEPGLDWIELCKMGAHKRTVPSLRDQTAYLGAWCAIANRDLDTGLALLQSLTTSRVRGLSTAIRVDIGNVLASEGTADRARALITKHRITDVAVLDRLTALLIDMNKLADATEINDLAIGYGDSAPNACERQARRVVMNPDAYRGSRLDRRELLHGRSPTCAELEREVGCWLALGRCAEYFKAQEKRTLAVMFIAYATEVLGSSNWIERVHHATEKMKTDEDLSIALAALKRIVRPECPDPLRPAVRSLLWRISYRTDLPPVTRERLDSLFDEVARCDP